MDSLLFENWHQLGAIHREKQEREKSEQREANRDEKEEARIARIQEDARLIEEFVKELSDEDEELFLAASNALGVHGFITNFISETREEKEEEFLYDLERLKEETLVYNDYAEFANDLLEDLIADLPQDHPALFYIDVQAFGDDLRHDHIIEELNKTYIFTYVS